MKSLRNNERSRSALKTAMIAAMLAMAMGALSGCNNGGLELPNLRLATVQKGGQTDQTWIAAMKPDGSDFRILTNDFYLAQQPSFEYDGKSFLFAGRKDKDGKNQIWRGGLDGKRFEAIVKEAEDPESPVAAPKLKPFRKGGIVYSAKATGAKSRALHFSLPDGSGIRRLTYGGHWDFDPQMLPDGRIQFRRFKAGANDPEDDATLRASESECMTIRPDGTGLAACIGPRRGKTDDPPALKAIESNGYEPATGDWAAPMVRPPMLTSVVNPEKKTGRLLCLNVYESRLEELKALPAGSLDRVRVERIGPQGNPNAEVDLLGEAPVEEDGSFLLEVPADTALQLTLLTKDGQEAAKFESGIWVRPNETRGCIGCHENPNLTPNNQRPLAVNKPPVLLAGGPAKK